MVTTGGFFIEEGDELGVLEIECTRIGVVEITPVKKAVPKPANKSARVLTSVQSRTQLEDKLRKKKEEEKKKARKKREREEKKKEEEEKKARKKREKEEK